MVAPSFPRTCLEAFDHFIPIEGDPPGRVSYHIPPGHQTKDSSKSSYNQAPTLAYLGSELDVLDLRFIWDTFAAPILQEEADLVEIMKSNGLDPLMPHRIERPTDGQLGLRSGIPYPEQHRICTEQDNVRLQQIQWLTPVNHLLERICEKAIEKGLFPPGSKLYQTSEYTCRLPGSRPDTAFMYESPTGKRILLFLMDFKPPGTICPEHYAGAVAVNTDELIGMIADAELIEETSLLQKDALILSQKLGKYAKNCPLVAVYDGTYMLICEYPAELVEPPEVRDIWSLLEERQASFASSESDSRTDGLVIESQEIVTALLYGERDDPSDGMNFRRVGVACVLRAVTEFYLL